MTPRDRRIEQRGFTLIELMVVVAIIAILSGLMFGLSGRTYGANAQNVSEQVVATCNLAKMRSVSTRRQHLLTIEPRKLTLWQAPTTGFGAVTSGSWVFVQQVTLPATISIWNVSSTVSATSGSSVSENTSLSYDMTFKPDGSSSGGTIFLTDHQHAKEFRVMIYRITGSSYARETW